jgi:nucleotide-binding universal stress UspA family protein
VLPWRWRGADHADSERILRFANQAASEIVGQLHIIHSIAIPICARRCDLAQQIHAAAAGSPAHCALHQKVGSNARVRIVVGSVKDALIEAAKRHDVDVLTIGRSPHPGSHGRLRDLTYAIVRDSPFSVMSI